MRQTMVLGLALAVLLAGCAGDDDTGDGGDGGDGGGGGGGGEMLEPLQFTGTATGFDQLEPVTGRCGPGSDCQTFSFEVPAGASYQTEIVLSWPTMGMDFDLYLQAFETELAASNADNPPGNSESISERLNPGAYDIQVNPVTAAQESFTVDVTFSDPQAPAGA